MARTSTAAAGSHGRLKTGAVESMRLYQEWLRIMVGTSDRQIPDKDARFADATWRANPLYRRLAQGYLAFCEAMDAVAEAQPDWRKRERDRFLAGILTSSLSPTNTLAGNPAALKHAVATRGLSLLRGARNMASDLVRNQGMPSQVRPGRFASAKTSR